MTAMLLRSSRCIPSGTQLCPLTLALPPQTLLYSYRRPVKRSRPAHGGLVCRASTSTPGGSSPAARHAVLHDFCMCIPYGGIAVLTGAALFFLNLTNIASTALVAGATSIAASVLSLQEWKAGNSSKQYTLTAAVSAAAVAYTTSASLNTLSGLPYWLSLALCVLSVAASAFCAYNVLAGGNPPPKGKH